MAPRLALVRPPGSLQRRQLALLLLCKGIVNVAYGPAGLGYRSRRLDAPGGQQPFEADPAVRKTSAHSCAVRSVFMARG